MNARSLALDILNEVLNKQAYANLSLKQRLSEVKPIDRSLVTQLVYGTLQNQIYCRNRWKKHVKQEPDALVASLLDMAVYQLMFLDKVPAYAILNEAQAYLSREHRGSINGLVNAVLRKIADEGNLALHGNDEVETVALNTSLPLWILRMWVSQYGQEKAFAAARSLIKPTLTSVRVNTLLATKEAFLEDPACTLGTIAPDAIRYAGNFLDSEWFFSGKGTLQDEASQLVIELTDVKPGMRVLDLCAAPGTKTSGLAQKMRNEGKIVALDLHANRVKLIDEGMEKLGITIVESHACDSRHCATVLAEEALFDVVLADVPCSGLGVLRRKPDIKARITPADLDSLQILQKELLEEAGNWVEKGGILVYSTCTLNQKESEKQVVLFLSLHPDYQLIEERTIFPQDYETDGFYMAKMQRNR
jgi:16S rRNA (cytosine967-C5)-methyltransferase